MYIFFLLAYVYSPPNPPAEKTLLYQVSFSNFSNVTHCVQKFGNKCKIKWTKEKSIKKRKLKKRKRIRKRKE